MKTHPGSLELKIEFDVDAKQRRAVKESLDRKLCQVPQVFAKLMWLASLRLGRSMEYWSIGFADLGSPLMISQALREAHEGVFTQWLGLKLDQQYEDLANYLSNAGAFVPQGGESLIPPSARGCERVLFLTDFAILSGLIEAESPFLALAS
jgi:hypothetical protein